MWRGGINADHTVDKHKKVRVVNIVTNECRILSSRERCPFLVVCEVVDTNLSGNDVRIFASGSDNIGATVQEILGSLRSSQNYPNDFTPTMIPHRLIESNSKTDDFSFPRQDHLVHLRQGHKKSFPRGGWQSNGEDWYHDGYTPFDTIRQEQLEVLHSQLSSATVPEVATSNHLATLSQHIEENL
jgi:hypothetical protein